MIDLDISGVMHAVEEWHDVAARIGAGTSTAVSAAADRGEAVAKVTAPHRSYALRDSIDGKLVSSSGMSADGEVRIDVPYAAVVVEGSRPHIIEPRRKKALRFKSGGETVFAKRVHHPGTKPNPFMETAIRPATEAQLVNTMEAVIEAAVHG